MKNFLIKAGNWLSQFTAEQIAWLFWALLAVALMALALSYWYKVNPKSLLSRIIAKVLSGIGSSSALLIFLAPLQQFLIVPRADILNLEHYLWLAVGITFFYWLLDILILKKRRAAAEEQAPLFVEFLGSFFPILIVIMLLRSFVIEPFRIPSASMEPTLYAGDMIAVKKWTYGLKVPLLGTELTEGRSPARGDIVVFKKPTDSKNFFIKRIVGVPGDEVVYSGKQLTINGQLQRYEMTAQPSLETGNRFRAIEIITDSDDPEQSTQHDIFFYPFKADGDEKSFIIPEGQYMMMGDNRDNSLDSRFWGFVPEENILGEASLIWMNLNCVMRKGGCDRIGTMLE